MQKIMYNNKYGLTRAVLRKIKKQTRRTINLPYKADFYDFGIDLNGKIYATFIDGEGREIDIFPKYQIGEEVAIAQSYKDILGEEYLPTSIEDEIITLVEANSKGISNKMFVRADLMPHRIKITNIRVERLQDISEEDCLKEGFEKINVNDSFGNMLSHWEYLLTYGDKFGRSLQLGSRYHKEAFSFLIDKTCGIGTWESNPWVFVYDFKLIN